MNFFQTIFFYMRGGRKCIRGKGNILQCSGSVRLRRVRIDIVGNGNRIVIHRGARLENCFIRMRGHGHLLEIGSKCRLKGTMWFEDSECAIHIGDATTFVNTGLAATEPLSIIRIGKDCMFAPGIDVRTGDSHSIIDQQTGKRINYAKNITIEDHVWVGADVRILKGVTIGHNSVIGSNSVVTKPIPAHCLAAGIPAKVVGEQVDWLRKRIYEDENMSGKAYQA